MMLRKGKRCGQLAKEPPPPKITPFTDRWPPPLETEIDIVTLAFHLNSALTKSKQTVRNRSPSQGI